MAGSAASQAETLSAGCAQLKTPRVPHFPSRLQAPTAEGAAAEQPRAVFVGLSHDRVSEYLRRTSAHHEACCLLRDPAALRRRLVGELGGGKTLEGAGLPPNEGWLAGLGPETSWRRWESQSLTAATGAYARAT